MVNDEKKILGKKKEIYETLREAGIEPRVDRQIEREKEEKNAKKNIQNLVKTHEKAKQKVLKAENTNISNKKEEFDRKAIIINHLKETFK